MNTNLLTKEQIEYTLENFTDLNIDKEEDAKILINLFIERIYLYENETIEIFLKSAINTRKITLSPNSSDRTQCGPPFLKNIPLLRVFYLVECKRQRLNVPIW